MNTLPVVSGWKICMFPCGCSFLSTLVHVPPLLVVFHVPMFGALACMHQSQVVRVVDGVPVFRKKQKAVPAPISCPEFSVIVLHVVPPSVDSAKPSFSWRQISR